MAEMTYRTNASQIAAEERDIRVEDYLNDKLQNSTDLANIDALLEDVKAQQVLLQQQVGKGSLKIKRKSDHASAARREKDSR